MTHFSSELALEFEKDQQWKEFDQMTSNLALNYSSPIFQTQIEDHLTASQRMKHKGFKLRVTECVIGYKSWLLHKPSFDGSLTRFGREVLKYPQRLIRVLTLIDRDSKFVINRLFQLVYSNFKKIGLLPFDSNNHSPRPNSILGIIRYELAQENRDEVPPLERLYQPPPLEPHNIPGNL